MPAAQPEILAFIQRKIETDEMWAEAFGKLAGLEAPTQNAIVYWMLDDINKSIQWDETLERTADELAVVAEEAVRKLRERDAQKAARRNQKAQKAMQSAD